MLGWCMGSAASALWALIWMRNVNTDVPPEFSTVPLRKCNKMHFSKDLNTFLRLWSFMGEFIGGCRGTAPINTLTFELVRQQSIQWQHNTHWKRSSSTFHTKSKLDQSVHCTWTPISFYDPLIAASLGELYARSRRSQLKASLSSEMYERGIYRPDCNSKLQISYAPLLLSPCMMTPVVY